MQHSEVVAAIKAGGDETTMLVVDEETDAFFRRCHVLPTQEHLTGRTLRADVGKTVPSYLNDKQGRWTPPVQPSSLTKSNLSGSMKALSLIGGFGEKSKQGVLGVDARLLDCKLLNVDDSGVSKQKKRKNNVNQERRPNHSSGLILTKSQI